MKTKSPLLAIAAVLIATGGVSQAQTSTIKFGPARYTTHSSTSGITGPGIPAGADAETGDATTVVLTYEKLIDPNLGFELALGYPPKIKAKATGSVAFLGTVLSAKSVSPTFFVNYHFRDPSESVRPYLGGGVNYTRFVSIQSSLSNDVKMSDSLGLAFQGGVDYALSPNWGLFASVAKIRVKSDLVAVTGTVLQTTIEFKPIVYTFGASYRF